MIRLDGQQGPFYEGATTDDRMKSRGFYFQGESGKRLMLEKIPPRRANLNEELIRKPWIFSFPSPKLKTSKKVLDLFIDNKYQVV
jgi:hypothetical protein